VYKRQLLGDPKNPKPHISLKTFKETYEKLILKIKKDTGAEITVISSASSDYEVTSARLSKLVKHGKYVLFGKPELLEQYNAAAKNLADKYACGYVDIYTVMKNNPDKHSLFIEDGVHLTNKGNMVVFEEIMKYLVKDSGK
jgi:hypothetical protein